MAIINSGLASPAKSRCHNSRCHKELPSAIEHRKTVGLALAGALLAIVCLGLTTGCSNLFNQHAQMMDVMRGAIAESARRLGDSSVGQYAAGAQVIDPGITIEAGLKYFATARYAGVAGQITASAQGQMDRELTPEALAELSAIYRNTALSDAARLARIGGWIDQWLTPPAATQPAKGEPVGMSDDPNCDELIVPKRAGQRAA